MCRAENTLKCKDFGAEGQTKQGRDRSDGSDSRCGAAVAEALSYPRTLILENDSTARDEIGRPIDIAGRNVVKISIRFTCGSSS